MKIKAVIVDAPAGGLTNTVKLSAYDSSTSSGIATWSSNPSQVAGSDGLVFGAATNGATAI